MINQQLRHSGYVINHVKYRNALFPRFVAIPPYNANFVWTNNGGTTNFNSTSFNWHIQDIAKLSYFFVLLIQNFIDLCYAILFSYNTGSRSPCVNICRPRAVTACTAICSSINREAIKRLIYVRVCDLTEDERLSLVCTNRTCLPTWRSPYFSWELCKPNPRILYLYWESRRYIDTFFLKYHEEENGGNYIRYVYLYKITF